MHLHETHVHTHPVSICVIASIRDTVEFYKRADFIDGFQNGRVTLFRCELTEINIACE